MTMSAGNGVQAVLDDVKPLVRAQHFMAVCDRLEAETKKAVNERRIADAASLAALLGSFRSITGDEEAALKALRQAEELEPDNPHRRVSTARHLFVRMQRDQEAERKIAALLGDPQVNADARHEALALLGRLALHAGRVMDAAGLLSQACEAAKVADLNAMLWDRGLASEMVERQAAGDAVRTYLATLIKRAEVEADEMTREEALQIRDRLRTQAGQ